MPLPLKTVLTVLVGCFAASAFAATSSELKEPPVFSSSHHELDLLITAREKAIQLGSYNPRAWVYEVCYRRDAQGNTCPRDSRTAAEYGGMRLQLMPGDHLRIRFINALPPAPPDADHLKDADGATLAANPTNLHTHGLIVEPRQPSASNPTYGDYVFVLAYPKGQLPKLAMPGLDVTDGPVDYDIYIPKNHPSGLFWIHPHVHGLALNQMSYGLAGLLTVGDVRDYVSGPTGRHKTDLDTRIAVRNLVIKDMQVQADNSVLSQEDPSFCAADPATPEDARDGDCDGQEYSDDSGVHTYTGGQWIFSINGQVHPTIHAASQGEIWRITQASGSRTYQASLVDSATGKPLVFQVLSLDGITLDATGGSDVLAEHTGHKFKPIPCPDSLRGDGRPVCTDALHLMPASRAEIWLPPQNKQVSAELITSSYSTGPAGDDWPAAHLAHVEFAAASADTVTAALTVKAQPGLLTSATGLLGSSVTIDAGKTGGEVALDSAASLAAAMPHGERESLQEHLHALSAPEGITSVPCTSLAPGHHRRVFLGVPLEDENGFGVGYEEVDARGRPVPGTYQAIEPFDHSLINVCVPLAPGNKTAREVWEIVNVSGEDHNFHIHQTKFQVMSTSDEAAPPRALMDNVPVLHGSEDCDGSVETWRSGACKVKSIFVKIPFSEVGDFVYHCHILEHEDGGMMAHIRVVPAH